MRDPEFPGNITYTVRDGRAPVTHNPGDEHLPPGGLGVGWVDIAYGDVTGDGLEEALVTTDIGTGGSAFAHCMYVYGWERGAPRLHFMFADGDRADGGLKDSYAQDGHLVLELWGKYHITERGELRGPGTIDVNDPDWAPACCPKVFTRARYALRGGRVTFVGLDEHPNPRNSDGYTPEHRPPS